VGFVPATKESKYTVDLHQMQLRLVAFSDAGQTWRTRSKDKEHAQCQSVSIRRGDRMAIAAFRRQYREFRLETFQVTSIDEQIETVLTLFLPVPRSSPLVFLSAVTGSPDSANQTLLYLFPAPSPASRVVMPEQPVSRF